MKKKLVFTVASLLLMHAHTQTSELTPEKDNTKKSDDQTQPLLRQAPKPSCMECFSHCLPENEKLAQDTTKTCCAVAGGGAGACCLLHFMIKPISICLGVTSVCCCIGHTCLKCRAKRHAEK